MDTLKIKKILAGLGISGLLIGAGQAGSALGAQSSCSGCGGGKSKAEQPKTSCGGATGCGGAPAKTKTESGPATTDTSGAATPPAEMQEGGSTDIAPPVGEAEKETTQAGSSPSSGSKGSKNTTKGSEAGNK